jgi:2-iminobutanoate/2-iminopropanoate deaminase
MNKKIIRTSDAPAPIGPYNQAVLANGVLYVSGQIGLDLSTGEFVKGGVAAETEKVMSHLGAVLREAGMDFSNVVKCSIFLEDMNDFAKVNEVYSRYFQRNPPARETVQVSMLPKGAKVEISAIAVKD